MKTSTEILSLGEDREDAEFFSQAERCDMRNAILKLWRNVSAGDIPNWGIRSTEQGDSGTTNKVELYNMAGPDQITIDLGMKITLGKREFFRVKPLSEPIERRRTYTIDITSPSELCQQLILRQTDFYRNDSLVYSEESRFIGHREYKDLAIYIGTILAKAPPKPDAGRPGILHLPELGLADQLAREAVASQPQEL